MKKLLTIAMITLATMVAKADLYLYWTIDAASAADFIYTEAYLVGNDGSTTSDLDAISGITSINSNVNGYANASTSYWVELYDSALQQVVARSSDVTYSTLVAGNYIYNDADMTTPASPSPFTFGGFTSTIPEPTSGLMLLLGLGTLALKRKVA